MDSLEQLPLLGGLRSALLEAASEIKAVLDGCPELDAVKGVSTSANPRSATVLFSAVRDTGLSIRLEGLDGCVVIVPDGCGGELEASGRVVIESPNPRYTYSLIMRSLIPIAAERGRNPGSRGRYVVLEEGAIIGQGVTIEDFVTVASGSLVGDGSYLMRGSAVGPRVQIGKRCVIKENAVLGDAGFGFGMSDGKPHVRMPQMGGLVLDDDVEIGSCATIAGGAIEPTIIKGGVKISNHVHVAHNCVIGERTMIACHAAISGSTVIGKDCWIAPGAVLRNKLHIGDRAFIGMGAVVVKDVPAGMTVYGNPARAREA